MKFKINNLPSGFSVFPYNWFNFASAERKNDFWGLPTTSAVVEAEYSKPLIKQPVGNIKNVIVVSDQDIKPSEFLEIIFSNRYIYYLIIISN